ncbi:MAG: carbohydrate porin [Steroidobacteraceae bacterium]
MKQIAQYTQRSVTPALIMLCIGMVLGTPRAAACDSEEPCDGLSLEIGYTGDGRHVAAGGLATGTAYSDVLDVAAGLRSTRLFSSSDFTARLSLMHTGGRSASEELVGDMLGINGIDAPPGWRLYEAWTQWDFGSRHTMSVRAGWLDLNAEFDAPATAEIFTHSAFGQGGDFGQSGVNGPASWPITALGLRVASASPAGYDFRLGVYEAVAGDVTRDRFVTTDWSSAEGALLVGELGVTRASWNRLAIGTWYYSSSFERIDAPLRPVAEQSGYGNGGIYLLADRRIFALDRWRVDGFLRIGAAAEEFNPLDKFLATGAVVAGLNPFRPDDRVAIGLLIGRTGAPYRRIVRAAAREPAAQELALELLYRAEIGDRLAIVPNLQLVRSPGADTQLSDAWVVGFRFELGMAHELPLQSQSVRGAPAAAVAVR